MRLAYLYSRYPVLSQTFCDTEMLELERRGFPLLIGAIHSPLTSIRHAQTRKLRAPVFYAPPSPILRIWEREARRDGRWPADLVAAHDEAFGAAVKACTRARNALYFADLFQRHGIERFHVHFANRAAHTALFLKKLSGIPFSVTAHGQDFMTDLGNDDLLRAICAEAEFVAVETEFSRRLLAEKCPGAAAKIHRVFNGMELTSFAPPAIQQRSNGTFRMVSIGRLVPFKGFTYLLEACAILKSRGVLFTCEIVGDGPLRPTLEAEIARLGLAREIVLAGALPEVEVRTRLRDCDAFVLASVLDEAGASDVFPTVILEAMASARPVVSTTLAGIPESVVDGETGLLVSPRDSHALAGALERLALEPELREQFGRAGRARVEQYFQISATVEPLLKLLGVADAQPPEPRAAAPSLAAGRVGYLIDRWPDPSLPHIEEELRELRRQNVPVTVFICAYDDSRRVPISSTDFALGAIFLPDEIVIEAEWQAERNTARRLEDERANSAHRVPAALFLRQARFAVVLRKMLADYGISHLHATSSRALVCAAAVHSLTGIAISATIETDAALPQGLLHELLRKCAGGRLPRANEYEQLSGDFLLEPVPLFSRVKMASGLATFDRRVDWQSWAKLLLRWSRPADRFPHE